MTEDELVAATFAREGVKYGDPSTSPPIDQPTGPGGITLPVLSEYLGYPATVADLKALTLGTAAPIVRWKLRTLAQNTHIHLVEYEPLRVQLLDFAYNSGPSLAIRWFQRVLRVKRTGRIDDATRAALDVVDPWLVNQALIAARLQMVDLWTDADQRRKQWEEGLENRVLSFSLLEVP
jgi:lysozyme family protein